MKVPAPKKKEKSVAEKKKTVKKPKDNWVRLGQTEDWEKVLQTTAGRCMLRDEFSFTHGHVYEEPIAVPLESTTSEDDWDSLKNIRRMIQTPIIDVAIANVLQYYPKIVGSPVSCVIGTRLAALQEPGTRVIQPVWSISGHYFLLVNVGDKRPTGEHIIYVMDSNQEWSLPSVEDHGCRNGPVTDAAASLLKNVPGREIFIQYLPCLQQSGSTACGAFCIANALLFCRACKGDIAGCMATLYAKNGTSGKVDKEVRKWLVAFMEDPMNLASVDQLIEVKAEKPKFMLPELVVEMNCLCKLPPNGDSILCDARTEKDWGGWVHEKCLSLPWPGLQQRIFTKPLVNAQSAFYISPFTYLKDPVFPEILSGVEVQQKLEILSESKAVSEVNWRIPLDVTACSDLFNLVERAECSGPEGYVTQRLMEHYLNLLTSENERVHHLQKSFWKLPMPELKQNRKNILGNKPHSGHIPSDEILAAWRLKQVQVLQTKNLSEVEIFLAAVKCNLSAEHYLVVNHIFFHSQAQQLLCCLLLYFFNGYFSVSAYSLIIFTSY